MGMTFDELEVYADLVELTKNNKGQFMHCSKRSIFVQALCEGDTSKKNY